MRRGYIAGALAGALAALLVVAGPAAAREEQRFEVRTNDYTFGQAPSWTPDGEHVVFHDDFGDGMQVHRSRLDGSGRVCLTCDRPGPNMVATYRPQGDKVLFHSWNGHQITIGAPGFGGLGSDVMVMNPDGSDVVTLTPSTEGHDNFHAYFSPDGRRIVWTHLNWNFVTEDGRGHWDVRVADYVNDERGPRLENVRVVRPPNGHFYETQWWAPDGSGFLYTESVDSATNLELFFCRLTAGGCKVTRLTDDPAWDEQAIFTPDGRKVIFMSTRDNPSMFNEYARAAAAAGVPADLDYLTLLPIFEAGFLQPIFPASNDLYELDLRSRRLRRLTRDGEDGWITPEFGWDRAGRRLLWTELKYHDGVRVPFVPDPASEVQQLAGFAQDPPTPSAGETHGGGQNFLIVRRTRIGRYRK